MDANYIDQYRYLGLNIAYYRKERLFSQEKLAEAVNTSRVQIGRIETASCAPSLDLIFRICEALQVSPRELFDFRE